MPKKSGQIKLFKDQPKAYGGTLLKTRKGRSQGRPLSTKQSLHLILKSSVAKGTWSFRYQANPIRIKKIILKFANKYGVTVHSLANVGNNLHMQIKLSNRYGYQPFIRAVTGAIAMAITGASRWKKLPNKLKFWDYRPFSRVVIGWRALLTLNDYIEVNKWESEGYGREQARLIVKASRRRDAIESTA